MKLLRHFALSDCIYLLSPLSFGDGQGERLLIHYLLKKSPHTISDDALEPLSAELEATRSIREPLPPVYGQISARKIYNLINGPYNLIASSQQPTSSQIIYNLINIK